MYLYNSVLFLFVSIMNKVFYIIKLKINIKKYYENYINYGRHFNIGNDHNLIAEFTLCRQKVQLFLQKNYSTFILDLYY